MFGYIEDRIKINSLACAEPFISSAGRPEYAIIGTDQKKGVLSEDCAGQSTCG